jgi:hypothetical protein
VLAEECLVAQVRARPDPQVAHVVAGLVGQQDADEQGEGPRPPVRLGWAGPIQVVATGAVVERRIVQGDLHVPWHFQGARAGQRLGQRERRTAGEQRQQCRGGGGFEEVEVGSPNLAGWWLAAEQLIDGARRRGQQLGRDDPGDDHEPAFGEGPQLLAIQHGRHSRTMAAPVGWQASTLRPSDDASAH